MAGMRRLAALASIGLAASLIAVPSAPAGAQAEIPCPSVVLDSPPAAPPRPDPPPYGPGEQRLGGAALATAGLIIPEGVATPPALTATSWLVADLDSGAVLGACGPHVHGVPASVQKLLLAATLLPELDLAEVVEVTAEDLDITPGSSAVGLLVGGEYSIETLWLGLMLSSGNDAANVLARVGGGDAGVAGGLRLMNEQAERLGAYQTHAVTPSGLDGPGQFTSAYDLALIARPLFERDDFLGYVSTERTQIPPQPPQDPRGFQIQNDNGLLLNYPGALGGKTGFTDLARHTFVGAAQRDGRRLVATLLGAETQPLRSWQQAALLLDWGFALPPAASVGQLLLPEEVAEVATSSTQHPGESAVPQLTEGGVASAGERVIGAVAGGSAAVAAVGIVVVLVLFARRRRPG